MTGIADPGMACMPQDDAVERASYHEVRGAGAMAVSA